jgi:hypothetical protein
MIDCIFSAAFFENLLGLDMIIRYPALGQQKAPDDEDPGSNGM